MCEYCENTKLLGNSKSLIEGVDAAIDGGKLRVSGWFDGIAGVQPLYIPVNYCPMCGRDLRGNDMPRLYISGPVTGKPDGNREAFEEARRELRHWHMVSIPHEYVDAETTHEEAMAILLHQLTDRTYSYRKGKCANLYDGVAILPGWEQSEGARLEKAVAVACGIPCKTVDEWLEEAR